MNNDKVKEGLFNNSDLKSIVKESIREAFYTPTTNEIPDFNNISFKLKFGNVILPALISRNTESTKSSSSTNKKYIFTLFKTNMDPMGKIFIGPFSVDYILRKKSLPLHLEKSFEDLGFGVPHIILESSKLYGKRLMVDYYGEVLPSLLSRNPQSNSLPYRISCFSKENQITAKGHFDLTEEEAEQILKTGQLPARLYKIHGDKIKNIKSDEWPSDYFDLRQLPNKKINELEILNEALFGQKLYVIITTTKYGDIIFKGIISKNTIYYQPEYRLTLFKNKNGKEIIDYHYAFDKNDLDYILKTKDLTGKLKKQLSNRFFCHPSQVKVEFVDKFDDKKQLSNEELFLMEESVRELDLWLENKQSIF